VGIQCICLHKSQILRHLGAAEGCATEPKPTGFNCIEIHQTRRIHYDFGLRGALHGNISITHATPDLVFLGATKMQVLFLACVSKLSMDGRPPNYWGWSNQKVCMLCHAHDENILHLFTKCRYSLTVWDKIFDSVAPHIPRRGDWTTFASIDEWWTSIGSLAGYPSKGWRSLLILVCWELWKERCDALGF
jgi:hypothetical protein